MSGDAPKLKNATFQRRGQGDAAEARTVTPPPHKPVSLWHRAYWWAHHHLTRNSQGEWKDTSGWSAHRSTVAPRSRKSYRERERDIERDVHAVARHAQVLREEAAEAHTGTRERADFYGTGKGSHDKRAERLIRGGGTAQREKHEAELRQADRARRKGIRW